MFKMESMIIGLLLLIVLLLFIILWRTEVSVRMLKKQIRYIGMEKITEGNNITSYEGKKNMEQSEGVLSGMQNNDEQNIGTGRSMEECEGENYNIAGCTERYKGTEEVQEKEDLINEVLSEIFG